MYPKKILAVIFAAFAILNTQSAFATLTPVTVNGDKLVSDSLLNVTWADLAPSIFMTWYGAEAYKPRNYGGYSDWRLATGDGSDPVVANNCYSGSPNELACLFLTQLNSTTQPQTESLYPFSNLTDGVYWSHEGYPSGGRAWLLYSSTGYQVQCYVEWNCGSGLYVRTGQEISVSSEVPGPNTLGLMISGILALRTIKKKNKIK